MMAGGPVAPVNKIIPLSTVDGPGARTSIFLQGCNIACAYCHNPETQRLCNSCGTCVGVCPVGALSMVQGKVVWDDKKCINCDACLRACPRYASPKVKVMTAEEVMQVVLKYRRFIRGITVSGGECTLYPEFLTELFRLAHKEGLTCLIDTNGMVDLEAQPALLEVCDGVMLDVKAWDREVYRALTKAEDNAVVKKNLALLAARGLIEELRLVYVDNMVDGDAVLQGVAAVLGAGVASVKLKLISFRCHGVRGPLADAPSPSAQQMQALRAKALELGFANIQLV